MTFLDAYALVALLADEPGADEVEDILRAGEARVVLTNFAEAVDIAQRVHRVPSEDVRAALEPVLMGGVLSATTSDVSHAWLAAEIRAKHYNRRTAAISMADCFLIAHAVTDAEPIATPDPALAAAARSEEVAVVALPDSRGKRP